VNSDVTTIEWIRDRIAHVVTPVALARIDRHVGALRAAVTDGKLRAAAKIARRLRSV
jgi:hypothetical protein